MNILQEAFQAAYKGLNAEQKKAVDTTEGPVMVVAGPGTGKTQVLALRIAHILQTTDTPASGILCLTFTRAGVTAMRERLVRYIGARAGEVRVTTFHSYATSLIEKHFSLLDFDGAPTLLSDEDTILLMDELLENTPWQYLRPRGNTARYFSDIKSLVSLLKRERLTVESFLGEVTKEIAMLTDSPDSISSRGATKGQLKKEVLKAVESLERTKEVVSFYEAYEAVKRERALMDYDDVLEYAVQLVEQSDDVCAEVREGALYVHIDEHQDSSGVQNSFIQAVWREVEQPNIFVVGDDRQLIYGFGGASLDYFQQFSTAFGKATLITLVQNYRSTKPILALADEMQKSALAGAALQSNAKESHPVLLSEYSYGRDEYIAAGLFFKSQHEKGVAFEDCALLVPKNKHVRAAVLALRALGIPVKSNTTVSLFSISEMTSLRTVLRIIANPFDSDAVKLSLFDRMSGISPIDAHRFLHERDARTVSVDDLSGSEYTRVWGEKLLSWISSSGTLPFELLVQTIGSELLIDTATDHETLMRRVEVLRTVLHTVSTFVGTKDNATVQDFLLYLDRLEQYNHNLKVAIFGAGEGVSVLTLHGSKGLEYNSVWIAHMNESVLMSGKKLGFALPQSIHDRIEERDEAVVRREVYVAITRAKVHCILSYAKKDANGGDLALANVISYIPDTHFIKKDAAATEKELLEHSPSVYVARETDVSKVNIEDLKHFVKEVYTDTNVSVTLLNNFFECPWKWYFRTIVQLPEAKTESLWFGSAVHGAIEGLLNKSVSLDEQSIADRIRTVLAREGIHDEKSIARLVAEGVPVVVRWAGKYLDRIAPTHTTEQKLFLQDSAFPHLKLYGKIDLVERFADGVVQVTDFKTGSVKTANAVEKRDDEERLSSLMRQLAMYSFLLEGVEKASVDQSRLLFLEADSADKNKLYSTHIDSTHLALLRQDIQEYDALVKSGEWVARECHAKPFGGGACEYCARAKAIYT